MEETKCDFCSLSQMLAKAKKHPPLLMQYLRLMMITIGKGGGGTSMRAMPLSARNPHPLPLLTAEVFLPFFSGLRLKGSSRVTRLGEFLAHWVIGLL
jgi:hypothetical protein